MTPTIVNSSKWTPSFKRYYSLYHSSAKFVGKMRGERLSFDSKWDDEYRIRRSYHYNGLHDGYCPEITIYTNNLEMLCELINDPYYENRLDYITTPRDTEHLNALSSSDERIIFRSKLFYNTYRYRAIANVNYYRNAPEADTVKQAVKFVDENFVDSRIVYNNGRVYWPNGFRRNWLTGNVATPKSIPKFPTVYTNDESSLFLLKMSWGTELNLLSERVMIV